MEETTEIEYLKDEIEELIKDCDFEELKLKDIVICRNLLDESQIVIIFKKERED